MLRDARKPISWAATPRRNVPLLHRCSQAAPSLAAFALLLAPTTVPAQPGYSRTDYATLSQPFTTVAVDLDMDDDLDLVVTNLASNSISIFLNAGGNFPTRFPTRTDYATGSGPFSVFASDLDGDGDSDLVVGNATGTTFSVFLNHGDGTFSAAVNYAAGSTSHGVLAADLDGDGDRDVALVNRDEHVLSVHERATPPILNPSRVTYPTGNSPIGIAAADLDGDTDVDLVTTAFFGNSVGVFLNAGNGTFPTRVDYATAGHARSVCARDLNGDGAADLAVTNADVGMVTVWWNDGNGVFSNRTDYPTGASPNSVAIADINGDTLNDLVVANGGENSVSCLQNLENSSFAPKIDTAVGAQPWSVLAADLDGDLDLDLVAANRNGNSISVLRLMGDVTAVEGPVSGIPSGLRLEQNRPNPACGSTNIGYTLAEGIRVVLRVWDARGRVVSTLVDEWKALDTGSYEAHWDGTDERGRSVPSGIYFYGTASRNGVGARRIVLTQ